MVALLVCGVLSLAPGAGRGASTDEQKLVAALDSLSAARRSELAEAFRSAAKTNPHEDAPELRQAAKLIQVRDGPELQELLRELRKRGLDWRDVLPETLRNQMLGGGDAENLAGSDAPTPPANDRTGPTQPEAPGTVRVYDPEYSAVAASETPEDMESPDAGMVPFTDAWTAAKSRAAKSLAPRTVDPKYHATLRAFFATPSP